MKKIECTDITNTFPQHVTKVSEPPTHRQARQLVHILLKIFLNGLLGGHDPEALQPNDVPDHGFVWIFRKLMMFARSQHPHNQKICGKRSISTQKHPTKNIFLQKKFFRNIFHFFRHLNISIFAILPIWGCVRPYF